MNREFESYALNERAVENAKQIEKLFDQFLNDVTNVIERPGSSGTILLPKQAMNGRYIALLRTHLEIASFYAKKALAVLPENQK